MKLQTLVAHDHAGNIVKIEIVRDPRATPRRLKKLLKTLPLVSRVERITTHTVEGKQ